MALFVISIPLMIVAVVPLVVVSRREITDLVHGAEAKFERHRRRHPVRHRAPMDRRTPTTSGHPRADEARQRPWHEPVLLERR
jgi:hypothetical protein